MIGVNNFVPQLLSDDSHLFRHISKPLALIRFEKSSNTFFKHNYLEFSRRDCRNTELNFQMTFSVAPKSPLLKFPIILRNWTPMNHSLVFSVVLVLSSSNHLFIRLSAGLSRW